MQVWLIGLGARRRGVVLCALKVMREESPRPAAGVGR